MSHTVARQERHAHAVDFSDRVRIRRESERGLDSLFAKKLQSFHLIEAGAADDSDWNFVHRSIRFTTERTERTKMFSVLFVLSVVIFISSIVSAIDR